MSWIRRHIRSGAWLALAALALHVALTFGHVHAEELSPASMAASSTAVTDAQASDLADAASVDASEQEQHRTLRAHHFCAVCAAISLLGSSVPPVAATLAPRQAVISIRRPDVPDTAPRKLRSSSKARAPPSA
jgi:hypothetical protein